MKTVCRGAEAVLYQDMLDGKKILVKDRVVKGYRIREIDDRIRKQRTKLEARVIERARRAGIDAPQVLVVEKNRIIMEFIDGDRVKDIMDGMGKERREETAEKIGVAVGKLHSAGIMHGDLTTSNMLLTGKKIYFIDFGLAKISSKIEDQAVDLYLFHEALKSAHFPCFQEVWGIALNVYKQNYFNSKEVLRRLEKIEKRRRYKS